MKYPTVSVIVTTYNYELWIEKAIDSVINQNFPKNEIEIIVVDDGSTDDTANKIKKYGNEIKYIYKLNEGQASAFNIGILNSSGNIICFLDADDLYLPNKLDQIVNEFSKDESILMITHDVIYVDEKDQPIEKVGYSSRASSAVCIQRGAIVSFLPIPAEIRICADYFFNLFYFMGKTLHLNEVLGFYRIHSRNNFSIFLKDDKALFIEKKIKSISNELKAIELMKVKFAEGVSANGEIANFIEILDKDAIYHIVLIDILQRNYWYGLKNIYKFIKVKSFSRYDIYQCLMLSISLFIWPLLPFKILMIKSNSKVIRSLKKLRRIVFPKGQ